MGLAAHVIQVIVRTAIDAVANAVPTRRRGSVVPGTASRSAAAMSARPSPIWSVDAPHVSARPSTGASGRRPNAARPSR